MKLNKKLIYSMIIILIIPLGLYIYDRSYIYPPIFFFDTNPVMIKLFKNKDNVNKADKYGITPLMKAVAMRNEKSVSLLLDKGANPNKDYNKSNNILSNNNSLSAYILIVSEDELTSSGINQKNIGIKYKILKWIKKRQE